MTGSIFQPVLGIHHVTAIAGDAQANIDFYGNVLGLRLVKLTVNYDDPASYHLYWGDGAGRPGTLLSFFAWPDAPVGREGTGQASSVSLSIPYGAISYWIERLASHRVEPEGILERMEEVVLRLRDPDGLALELIAHGGGEGLQPWEDGPVPPERAIRGLRAVTWAVQDPAPTAALLVEGLGLEQLREPTGARHRFRSSFLGPGALVDLLTTPHLEPGRVARGTVHHVAWRVASDEAHEAWRERLRSRGVRVTPVVDRRYFRSVYFREPSGALLELATDPPGFTIDEPLEQLGQGLMLPPWLEPERPRLLASLQPLRRPGVAEAADLDRPR